MTTSFSSVLNHFPILSPGMLLIETLLNDFWLQMVLDSLLYFSCNNVGFVQGIHLGSCARWDRTTGLWTEELSPNLGVGSFTDKDVSQKISASMSAVFASILLSLSVGLEFWDRLGDELCRSLCSAGLRCI